MDTSIVSRVESHAERGSAVSSSSPGLLIVVWRWLNDAGFRAVMPLSVPQVSSDHSQVASLSVDRGDRVGGCSLGSARKHQDE